VAHRFDRPQHVANQPGVVDINSGISSAHYRDVGRLGGLALMPFVAVALYDRSPQAMT